MAQIVSSKKACTVNPLKMSQPIGGALAFMGVNNCMPLLHRLAGLYVIRPGAVRQAFP